MGILRQFDNASLAERILLLDELEKSGGVDAIPELEAIYGSANLDDAVRHSVSDTLRALLAGSEAETVRGLDSENASLRRMCVQIAGQQAFASATPALIQMASREADPDILLQILSALAALNPPEALEIYRRHAAHGDSLVAAHSVERLGVLGDVASTETLCRLIDEADSEGRFEACDVVTEKAIAALAGLGTADSIAYLVSKLHHKNPTARRFIQENLLRIGSRALPFVAKLFERDDVDEQILAANLIGLIGDRKGGDILVEAFDRNASQHPNLRFAIYEALGYVRSLKGLVCLMDGLAEEDPMTLMGVISALDRLVSPTVVAKMGGLARTGGPESLRLVDAIVAARATDLFGALYDDPAVADPIVARVAQSNDPEVLAAFREKLLALEGDRARSDAGKLEATRIRTGAKKVMAVDDSKSMLLFYKSIAAEMELEIATAVNGKEALELIDRGQTFDLIITDLNMPIMDGIEFSRKVRTHCIAQETPILMATTESETSQRLLAERAGVTGFVNKPIKAETLQAAIRRYV